MTRSITSVFALAILCAASTAASAQTTIPGQYWNPTLPPASSPPPPPTPPAATPGLSPVPRVIGESSETRLPGVIGESSTSRPRRHIAPVRSGIVRETSNDRAIRCGQYAAAAGVPGALVGRYVGDCINTR